MITLDKSKWGAEAEMATAENCGDLYELWKESLEERKEEGHGY